MTRSIARLLLAPTFVVAAAILVKSPGDVGDGFAAGAVAALAVLLQYVAFGVTEAERLLPARALIVAAPAGLALALVTAFVPALLGEPIVSHLPSAGTAAASIGTLKLATALVFDLGVALLVLGAVVGVLRIVASGGSR